MLTGAPVVASDLRASAALVLAGLAAKGKTTIQGLHHLDRGYEKLESKLLSIGARLQRIPSSRGSVDSQLGANMAPNPETLSSPTH